ncbi:MAG TPA: TadE/TadG family type IV pilus assembly protein [Acetobacteraceae bacterium]|nr:TadE/TadG family type IV pilus assembly protein [Acetobacteraceae bacterium]
MPQGASESGGAVSGAARLARLARLAGGPRGATRYPGGATRDPGGATRGPRDATRPRLRDIAGCRRGVAAIEFALLATPFLTLVFGFIAVSTVFYTWSTMQNAAQYAAMLVATGQITSLSTGTISSSNNTATTQCSSSLTSTEAEYYACSSLPSWATFSVTTTETCSVPSVEVSVSVNGSAAAIVDFFGIFAGTTLTSNATVMKEGSCP